MAIEFNSLEDLYNRIKPALLVKKNDLLRNGISYIKEEDIWNYFKEIKWQSAKDLSLHDMVHDIINIDNYYIDKYVKEKMQTQKRTPYFDE